jgi:hypothetical protein
MIAAVSLRLLYLIFLQVLGLIRLFALNLGAGEGAGATRRVRAIG